MSVIYDKAHLVSEDLVSKNKVDNVVAFDPTIILVISQILIQIIAAYVKCNKPAGEIKASMSSPGLIERFVLRRVIRNTINDHEMERHLADPLFKSMLSLGKQQSLDDVVAMCEEVPVD